MKILSSILDTNQREIGKLQKRVEKINELEDEVKKLKDTQFPKKTEEFKKLIKDGKSLEDLLPQVYALSREASKRVLGLRPYDVQLMAGIALFEGRVAEQRTGEGKTLTAVAPLYLRALAGHGVHLVTVNDYLARIGAGWNGAVFAFLGMSVGVICQEGKSYIYDPGYSDTTHGDSRLEHLRPVPRREAYLADITYGTNNEYGFDYLRDNMVQSLDQMVQRGHYFAIVDEVDSVLIDEARTPLIISAPDTEPTQKYYQFAQIAEKLSVETDFVIDEKAKSAALTEHGITKVEKILGVDNLYEKDFEAIHHIENALRAKSLYLADKEYIVKDGEIIIVDEFTGRLMPGRRWSDGLHQAVEAKEGVVIQQESKTMATISFQNYFRLYDHLSGMTGTAATEAEEFRKIYKLEVVVVPTHRPMVRKDHPDSIYKTLRAKYSAVAEEIGELHKQGRPVLVGTTSIEKNEIISDFLKRKKVPHNVLNAKNHEREAAILADAGKVGAVTVATNMAGRGVDIILGGAMPDRDSKEFKKWEEEHKKVVDSGGLHVIGTERHEARRIDNQLRGRAGRQGDPGSSKFYLSLEDDLMRIFGGEQITKLMNMLKIPEDQAIENRMVSKAIESSQIKVEGHNFDIRKRLVEYDDVNNQQREIVYKLRRRILESIDVKEEILEKLKQQVDHQIALSWPEGEEKLDSEKLISGLLEVIPFDTTSLSTIKKDLTKQKDKEELAVFLEKIVESAHKSREDSITPSNMRQIEKYAYLGSIDHHWVEHIDSLDSLREGMNLRSYGQKDPIVEFKNEAYTMFEGLVDKIDQELSRRLFRIQIMNEPRPEIPLERLVENVDTSDMTGLVDPSEQKQVKPKSKVTKSKIGRNDPCWCGSGKKWKKCHYPKVG
jgi:preprotein translocase subunit SecA